MSAIQRAVAMAGSQVKLAERLGVSQPAVSSWIRDGYVPIERAAQIENQFGIPATTLVDPTIVNLLGKCPNCDE
jgi:DNA-binding transcriptional regulator YdaS (Cro superfamily)